MEEDKLEVEESKRSAPARVIDQSKSNMPLANEIEDLKELLEQNAASLGIDQKAKTLLN